VIGFFRRLIRRYGFFRKPYVSPFVDADGWERHDFFTAHKAKTERLAQIARERDALKEQLAKAIRDKKARAPIYAKLRALSVEELNLEAGK
jgi:hypothetical protein